MIVVRLVLLAVVLGVALMHHLGGAQHDSGSCGGPVASSMTVPAHQDDASTPRHDAVPDGADAGGLLHLCLAVLTALGIVLVLGVPGVLDRPTGGSRRLVGPDGGGSSRAPPAARRLAALQVLRV